MPFRLRRPSFSISIAREALESIFDECDKYDADETGGRLLGMYRQNKDGYDIEVKAVLEPGPNAERSPTFFMQDGEYQEHQFRAIEAAHPDVEHLGNWHTHHVNGLPTLSGGDKTTYLKTVNHPKHNTDFFYALLVVHKNHSANPRYDIKHFIFKRGEDAFYEIPPSQVRLTDTPLLQPRKDVARGKPLQQADHQDRPQPERAKDQEFFSDFYPELGARLAKDIGALYWKGPLPLVDGSHAEVVVMEDRHQSAPSYSIAGSSKNPALADIIEDYKKRNFQSARHALLHLERDLNRALYREKRV